MNIEKIEIKNFKSIDHLLLEDISPFMVFAGANGSGKSNIADALAFVGAVVARGASQALREFGGFDYVHCLKRRKNQRTTISFTIEIQLESQLYQYDLVIKEANNTPQLTEILKINKQVVVERKAGKHFKVRVLGSEDLQQLPQMQSDISAISTGFVNAEHFRLFLLNIRVFRIDPLAAKEPDSYASDNTELDTHGKNVATLLARELKKEDFAEQVMEWIELIVPSMEGISTQKQQLDGSIVLTFKEEGTRSHFPARLVSDGTIYTLCILVAVLTRANQYGITIIEEPERGIHPKAIGELMDLMRENANQSHAIFLTSHSESVVRKLAAKELSLVDKKQGITQVQSALAAAIDSNKIALDKAWLTNLFDGGLPW